MKKVLTITVLAVGLIASSGTEAKASSFSISIGNPYFHPYPVYGHYYRPVPVYYSYYEPRRYYPKPKRYYKRGHQHGHDKHHKHRSRGDNRGHRR